MAGSSGDNDGHGNGGSGSGAGGPANGHRPSDRPGHNWNNANKNDDRYGGNRYGPGGNRMPGDSSDGYGRPSYDRYPDSTPNDYGKFFFSR